MIMQKKILTLLVLLLTAATGAWAQEQRETIVTTANVVEGTHFTISNNDAFVDAQGMNADEGITVTPKNGETITKVFIISTFGYSYINDGNTSVSSGTKEVTDAGVINVIGVNASTFTFTCSNTSAQFSQFVVYYTEASAGIDLTPSEGNKVWTLASMPAGDVELHVEYYPGMLTLPAGTDAGTVTVEGMTDTALPAGFEKDAEGNIYVAEGTTFTVKATPAEGYHFVCWSDDETNTNPEREITMPAQDLAFSATAIFAENEYDITFSEGTNPDPENPEWTATPNPAKTKQTVTVTYTGTKKVIGVKAEKKAAAPTLKDALADGATVVINYTWFDENVTTFTYTNNGGTYTGSATGTDAGYFANGMSMSGTTLRFTASNTDATEANVSIDFYTDTNEYYFNSKDTGFTSFTISVNGTDLTSQLKEVK